MEPKPVVVPEGQRYACLQCTRCCRGWNIAVSKDVETYLLTIDWPKHAPRLQGQELFLTGKRSTLIRKGKDNACVFLEADGRCVIHNVGGYDRKSLVCRLFPLSFVTTPRERLLFLSFACPAVVRNQGEPLADQQAALAALGEKSGEYSVTLPDEVRLTGSRTISWDLYGRIEELLLAILERPGVPRRERLIAGHAAVAALAGAAEAGQPLEPLLDAPPVGDWLKAARELPADTPQQQRIILAAFIGPSEQFYARELRRRLATSFRIVAGAGSVHLNSLGIDVPTAALARVSSRRFDDGELEPVDRFIRHFVRRKSLVFPLPLRDSYQFFLLSLGLVKWYARAAAVAAGRADAAPEDFNTALETVERFYVSHRAFYYNLVDNPFAAFFVNRLFTDWRYPATILREPQ